MSNYIECGDRIAFHPGYYIKELVEESGLTQEDFAKRLDTTPKNLSILIRGEQSLSVDIAMKLSRMVGTSVSYWLNLQNAYDSMVAEFKLEEELKYERRVFEYYDYSFFKKKYGLPGFTGNTDEQIKALREYLNVSTLTVFTRKDMTVSFRDSSDLLLESNIVHANTMVQLSINKALKIDAPRYNKKFFLSAVDNVLSLAKNHTDLLTSIEHSFREAGVIFVIQPDIAGSKICGATKKISDKILLMINEIKLYADTFWFALFHEISHIICGDYGISFEKQSGEKESAADRFAEDNLIPPEDYTHFVSENHFDVKDITRFADRIDRDPGIVLGRLEQDGLVAVDDSSMKQLRRKLVLRTADH